MDVVGKSLLERVIDRLHLSTVLEDVVVATSTNSLDDSIDKLCKEKKIHCFRGSEDNVLNRVYLAAKQYEAEIIVQSGADCPFYDPELVDLLVNMMRWGGFSYTANDMELTYPEGVDAHVIHFDALEASNREATLPEELDDTPRFIWNHEDRFPIFNLKALPGSKLNRPDIRLTIDYPEDLELCRKVYGHFKNFSVPFTTVELIQFLDSKPDWKKINENCEQKSAAYIKKEG